MRRLSWILMLLLVASAATADDGELFRKNVSKTPDLETEHATVKMMKLYVPAQTSGGEHTAIEYYDAEGALAETRDQAKPLVAFYHDGEVEHVPDVGFPGHGRKDVFGAYSLDDGATWKRKNLSNTGDLSSFTLRDGTDYPGDTFRLFAAAAGNKVMVAWASRYCQGGNPGYTLSDDEILFIASLVGEDDAACTDDDTETLCLYMEDYWGVAGSQGSVDYGESDIVEYQAIGEVPYACLWTARGTLELDDEGLYEIVWRKAERLTSGRRDVHRIEVAAVGGAGFVVTWQEDPEGLRPGKGEGPGEGWSGAIGNHQTDIWYSHVAWENFDLVYVAGSDPIPYAEYTGDQIPQAGVPMAMPVRLTDNAMCVMADADGSSDDEYCYMDFDGSGSADFCASSVSYSIDTPEGPDQTVEMCVTEDGRLMRGNIASTRARTHLRGYDSDGDGTMDSAWVALAYEESKGLGEEDDLEPEKIDMGKNIWYHTFEMFSPELVSQGLMLNQPALYPDDLFPSVDYLTAVPLGEGTSFAVIDPDPIYDAAGLESDLYQAEIARRFSMISQPAHKAGPSGVVAFAMFKQGIIRQGGPADVMARRFVLPDTFDPVVENPFDYANMACGEWAFTDGSNPRYVKGLCLAPAINMSATKVVDCEDGADNCGYDDFPWDELFADVDMSVTSGLPKVTEWRQCPGGLDCDDTVDFGFDDPTWLNPYDVAKGHRGFMKGDHIMMMYAWSPNWLANTVGHDNYNLYVRRSFDGGVTWTTLPADYSVELPEGVTVAADGTEHCEWYGLPGSVTEFDSCTTYPAGAPEQARNVSQIVGTKLTVLDPRFTPTSGSILTEGDFLYPDDEEDPSKFFVTFEVGDNTTVIDGEATPMDMYYSRAFNFGDEYELVLDEETGELYFDWLENKKKYHAAEAAVTANPGGTFFYAIWNQWQEDKQENIFDSDAILRRVMFLDEEDLTPPSGGGGGGGKKDK